MADTVKCWPLPLTCMTLLLLAACGGSGSSGSSASSGSGGATTYDVSAAAATGGSISPASASVAPGGTTTFSVTAKTGYVITGVTGCGGSLSGSTYTTGPVNADCAVTVSASATFTWASGSRTVDASGVYGTLGEAAATNAPGARANPVSWTDASGQLWLFGGYGFDSAGTQDELNDLWEYSPSAGQWTWIGGLSTVDAPGVYGTLGVAAATNMPGARDSAVIWTDASGNVWLFGGYGYDSKGTLGNLNDLWEYSPSSGQWTWISGSSTANAPADYGVEGVAAATNVPGARYSAVSWTDASGNFWLLGGAGSDVGGNSGVLGDLWTYSPASGQWTWVGGSNVANVGGAYNIQGVALATNAPGARVAAAGWTDPSGNLWLFGGYGYDSAGTEDNLNDLWEYSPSSGEWTWVGGSSTAGAPGVYGTQGVAAASNVPGARGSPVTWTDADGNLWLFGGYVYVSSTGTFNEQNDLWEYSPTSGQWTWVAGSDGVNATGMYGTQGVAAAANLPGGRDSGAGWTDPSGNFWLFGGYGYDSAGKDDELNDLWEYPAP